MTLLRVRLFFDAEAASSDEIDASPLLTCETGFTDDDEDEDEDDDDDDDEEEAPKCDDDTAI